eukprot:GHVN01095303.1.p1 GENE.GHVN01095303.1~~GHVN01095303.1.p1  ORF type:complete len:428 (+),score=51.59 GHVN01095303.1:813-2096(+)
MTDAGSAVPPVCGRPPRSSLAPLLPPPPPMDQKPVFPVYQTPTVLGATLRPLLLGRAATGRVGAHGGHWVRAFGLAASTSIDQCKAHFEKVGFVLSVQYPKNGLRQPGGSVFVEYSTALEAERAQSQLSGFSLNGCPIQIEVWSSPYGGDDPLRAPPLLIGAPPPALIQVHPSVPPPPSHKVSNDYGEPGYGYQPLLRSHPGAQPSQYASTEAIPPPRRPAQLRSPPHPTPPPPRTVVSTAQAHGHPGAPQSWRASSARHMTAVQPPSPPSHGGAAISPQPHTAPNAHGIEAHRHGHSGHRHGYIEASHSHHSSNVHERKQVYYDDLYQHLPEEKQPPPTSHAMAGSHMSGSRYTAPVAAPVAGPNAASVLVSNVPFNLGADEIQEAFSSIGSVCRTEILLNSEQQHTGLVSVQFKSQESAEDAVSK